MFQCLKNNFFHTFPFVGAHFDGHYHIAVHRVGAKPNFERNCSPLTIQLNFLKLISFASKLDRFQAGANFCYKYLVVTSHRLHFTPLHFRGLHTAFISTISKYWSFSSISTYLGLANMPFNLHLPSIYYYYYQDNNFLQAHVKPASNTCISLIWRVSN